MAKTSPKQTATAWVKRETGTGSTTWEAAERPTEARWLVYALGGGLGHLTRALSLARAASRRDVSVTILANTSWVPRVVEQFTPPPGLELVALDAATTPERVGLLVREVLRRPFDRWLVDTFPAGLARELPPRGPCPRVLVHRDLQPRALRPADPRYDLVIRPGERGPLPDTRTTLWTEPWLLRDPGALPPGAVLRQRLGQQAPAILVVGAGRAQEVGIAATIAQELPLALPDAQVRWATLAPTPAGAPVPLHHYPLLELLPAFDAVVGAGGYHTVHECRAVGVPLVALAHPRRYDRQRRRLRPCEHVTPRTLLPRLHEVLARERPEPPRGTNGAHEAVEAILAL